MLKQLIKRVLMSLGVWYTFRRAIKSLLINDTDIENKYGQIDTWYFPKENIDLQYAVDDPYSKLWFFPRYDRGRYHEPAVTNLFIELINENDTVIDVGVHLGYFTCLSGILADKGDVHSFEVDPSCIPLIKKNIKKNNLTNVTLQNLAVSDHVGFESISLGTGPNPSLKIQTEQGSSEVACITVDHYVRKTGIVPNLIKIDVEGAELKVLRGMQTTLKQNNLLLLLELHVNELRTIFQSNYSEILSMLFSNGFTVYKIKNHRSAESKLNKLNRNANLKGNEMLLCRKD